MKSIRKEIGSEAGAAVPASVHTRETAAAPTARTRETGPAPALKREYHGFGPVYDGHSRVLILGSFPSVKSRAQNFYYGHPQNRFWPVLAAVFGEAVPDEIDAKRAFVLRHGIALWDVLESCEIRGSSDASIRGAVPVEIGTVTGACRIGTIFVNGGTAKKYYDRYLKALTGSEAVQLPSTSPANAAWSMERLLSVWKPAILGALEEKSSPAPPGSTEENRRRKTEKTTQE